MMPAGKILEMRSVLVVDSDEGSLNLIQGHLDSLLGKRAVISFEADAAAAWTRIRGSNPDLIIIGMNLSPFGGLGLFNRIRANVQHALTPVIMLCGHQDRADFSLLKEFPGTAMLNKPVESGALAKAVQQCSDELAWYRSKAEYVRKLIEDAWTDQDKIVTHATHVLETAPNPVPLCLLIAKQLANYAMHFEAEAIYRKVLEVDHENLQALAGLGRLLYLCSRGDEAAVYLRIANHLAPGNVERLCSLGELELTDFDVDSAKDHFHKAMRIDPTHEKAVAGSLIAENMEEYVAQYARFSQKRSFASICNTVGVYLVRNGEMKRGIDQYMAAMSFLRDDETKGRVSFNIGLGFLRWGKPSEALSWFQRALQASRGSQPKVSKYLHIAMSNMEHGGGKHMVANDASFAAPAPAGQLKVSTLAAVEEEQFEDFDLFDR